MNIRYRIAASAFFDDELRSGTRGTRSRATRKQCAFYSRLRKDLIALAAGTQVPAGVEKKLFARLRLNSLRAEDVRPRKALRVSFDLIPSVAVRRRKKKH